MAIRGISIKLTEAFELATKLTKNIDFKVLFVCLFFLILLVLFSQHRNGVSDVVNKHCKKRFYVYVIDTSMGSLVLSDVT